MLKPLRYGPLEDQTIRILTLLPGTDSDPLMGRLTTESLASKPSYEAISYVWGTGPRSFSLSTEDGCTLPLTQSIHDALSRMRKLDEPRRLWADQICINQEDVVERSQQVRLMNAVYKNARRILVWLGRDDQGAAEDAVRMVYKLDDIFGDEAKTEAFRVEHEENLGSVGDKDWIPLAKLTKLAWFSRIWIVQEIGTDAPATLFWGNTEIDWTALSNVAGILNQNYHHLRARFHIGTSSIRYLYQRFVEPEDEYDQYHNRGSFVYELHRARHLLAQDPRDHVYAFLGHFSLTKGSKQLQALEADYSRPVEEVFIDVAVRDLQGAETLILLSANHNAQPGCHRLPQKGPRLALPSWVPDWRELPVHVIGSPETPHRAAGETRPDLSIEAGGRVLKLRGIHVDTIDRHSHTFHGRSFHLDTKVNAGTSSSASRASSRSGHRRTKSFSSSPTHHSSNAHLSATVNLNHHHENHGHAYSHKKNDLDSHHRPRSRSPNPNRHGSPAGMGPPFSRMRPIEVIWKHLCGYGSFTLTPPYPPTAGGQRHFAPTESAFFALVQTLTNASIGIDRSRAYESVPREEWLMHGASYIVRALTGAGPGEGNDSGGSASSATASLPSLSPASTFPLSNQSSASSHLSISATLKSLARTGNPFKWSHEATLVTRHRRFAVTAKGYYVLGPDAIEVGDAVVVLHGGRTPFLLRRRDADADADADADGRGEGSGAKDEWTLVGECYVHGLMDGEALALDGAVEEVFTVR